MQNKLTKEEKTKIINMLPDLKIGQVLLYFGAFLDGSRYRISSKVIENGAFEIREPDIKKSKENNFNAGGEYWRDFKEPGGYGVGAFNLLRYLLGVSDYKDIDTVLLFIKENFLNENLEFKQNINNQYLQLSQSKLAKEEKTFQPPIEYSEYFQEGLIYLNEKRGIPKELIERVKNDEMGRIYVTKTFYGDKRLAFVGKMNSEERSIYGDFKGTGEGSDKVISGFEVSGDDNACEQEDGFIKKGTGCFALTEAAIDALSYNALFPDRFVISSNGCGNFKLQYNKAIAYFDSDMDISIRVAFDADLAGDVAAQKLFNAIYVRCILCKKYEKELKEHFKYLINEEEPDGWKKGIDNLILNGKINIIISSSNENELFFNNPFFIEKYKIIDNETNEVFFDNPKIHFKIDDKDLLDVLKIKPNHIINVKKENYEKLIQTGKLVRERPIDVKDWNEVLKQQGISYLNKFSECFENKFKDKNGNIVKPELDDSKCPVSFYRERNLFEKEENIKKLKQYFVSSDKENENNSLKIENEKQELLSSEKYMKFLELSRKRMSLFKHQQTKINEENRGNVSQNMMMQNEDDKNEQKKEQKEIKFLGRTINTQDNIVKNDVIKEAKIEEEDNKNKMINLRNPMTMFKHFK